MLMSQCALAAGGKLLNGDCEFSRLSTDTRQLRSGEVFVALRGPNFDGHRFLSEAARKGACALVVDRGDESVDLPQLVVENTTLALGAIATLKRTAFDGTLIGITGSSGKTSVKGMLTAILARCGSVKATQGNYNNHIGVPLTLMDVEAEDEFAVVEMGTNSPGEIAYLAGLAQPEIALVNNIMPAHLAGFGTLRAIAEEKGRIYGALEYDDRAVLNLNDDFAAYFLEITDGRERWGFCVDEPGVSAPADLTLVRAEELRADTAGRPIFNLVYKGTRVAVRLSVLGRHNVANALAAASCALAAGAPVEDVVEGLMAFHGAPGRMQVCESWNGALLIDDTYNANPGSVRAAIDYLTSVGRPAVLVLGDLGELGEGPEQVHADLGDYARQSGVKQLFTCGSLSEHASAAFGVGGYHADNQEALVKKIRSSVSPDGVVLVKGSRAARMEKVVRAIGKTGEQE